jgi:DNA-binding transcriptional regulator YiaG
MANAGKSSMSKREDNELAKTIRNLRAKLGLTQEQFAAKVGVTWSTVNRWENARGRPSPLARRRVEELQEEFSEGKEEVGS